MLTMMIAQGVVNHTPMAGQRRIAHGAAKPEKQRGESEVREQPTGERDPLQDPDDEAGHHDREADPAAEHPALKHIVAA